MAKLTEYEAKATLNQDDILITDGQDGTKKITAKNLANTLVGMSDKVAEIEGDIDDVKAQADKLIELPTENLLDITDITDVYNATFSTDTENNTITVTTSDKIYGCAQTADTFISQNLVAGESYRIHAKAEFLSGTPTVRVAIRGMDGNPNQIACALALENGESGFMDFTADEYMKRVSLFVTMADSASASVKFSELWLKEYDTSGKDTEAREEINSIKERTENLEKGFSSITIRKAVIGNPVTLDSAAKDVPFQNMIVNVEPVQLGTGDPSSENVRPIIGRNKAVISRSAKNMLNPFEPLYGADITYDMSTLLNQKININKINIRPVDNGDGTFTMPYTVAWGRRAYVFDLIPGVTYHFYAKFTGADPAGSYGYLSADNVVLTASGINHNANLVRDLNFIGTEQRRKAYVYFTSRKANQSVVITNPSLEIGTARTVYEPHTGDVFEVAFPSEAGTVYGGVLDLTAGTLTVRWGNIDSYAGETLPGEWISSMDVYSSEAVPTIGAQVVYELAEPIVYQMTPTRINALEGFNVVRTDCGTVEFEYALDPGIAIRDEEAITRAMMGEASGETAFQALTAGEYVVMENKFYVVTSDISEGETLTPGTNIEETTVGEELQVGSAPTSIFNGEPYTGRYDYKTPLTEYCAMFNGKDNVESFAFFTDPHVLGFDDDARNETKKNNYLKRVQKTFNDSPCSFLVCGGDWLNNDTTPGEACYRLGNLRGIADHLLGGCKLVNGNHDLNSQGISEAGASRGTGILSNETIAAVMYRDTDTKKAYYSFDGANSKCYVLDSGKDSSHSSMSEYDWEQVEWLAGKLSEDDPEHAIIFLHIITISGNVQTFASTFGALVEGYNGHTSVTLNGVEYSFTSCTGHVDLWLAGHTHSDSTGTLGGIPYIITATNSFSSDVPLIDLVLVDYDNSVVNTVRVGGTGENRTISLA